MKDNTPKEEIHVDRIHYNVYGVGKDSNKFVKKGWNFCIFYGFEKPPEKENQEQIHLHNDTNLVDDYNIGIDDDFLDQHFI